jgi:hypothetical protein
MAFDLYAWESPRDLDAERVEALLEGWREAGGEPAQSPFEPSTNVAWFYRELMKDVPGIVASSDALPDPSKAPIWLAMGPDPQPARIVAISLAPTAPADTLESIYSLAAKYDLVLYDPRNRRLHLPLDEMGAYASATFWPAGAIQAAVAGGIGAVIAVAAWFLGIPVLSGVLMVVGGFMFVMAIFTFVHEGRKPASKPRRGGESPPGD